MGKRLLLFILLSLLTVNAYCADSAISGLKDTNTPIGAIQLYAGASAPTGWVLCDGSSLLRAGTYANLFAVIGTTYGSADGTHFNVPDLRGRATIGVGQGTGLTNRVLATTGGEETHLLTVPEMPSHTHTQGAHTHIQDAHTHTWGDTLNGYAPNSGAAIIGRSNLTPRNVGTDSTTATNQNTTATNQNTGGGGAHNIMQPWLALNYIIKY